MNDLLTQYSEISVLKGKKAVKAGDAGSRKEEAVKGKVSYSSKW